MLLHTNGDSPSLLNVFKAMWAVHWAALCICSQMQNSHTRSHVTTLITVGVNTEWATERISAHYRRSRRLDSAVPGGTREHGPTGLCPPQVPPAATTQRLLPRDGACRGLRACARSGSARRRGNAGRGSVGTTACRRAAPLVLKTATSERPMRVGEGRAG